MHRQISAAALAFAAILSFGSNVHAQGTSRLRVRVTVVPAVTATSSAPSQLSVQSAPDAELIWAGVQQSHVITRNANAAEISKDWLNSSNPCASEGTKVLHTSSDAGSCEITINTVEFVTE
jgi:precorrin-4 methylase